MAIWFFYKGDLKPKPLVRIYIILGKVRSLGKSPVSRPLEHITAVKSSPLVRIDYLFVFLQLMGRE